MISARYVHHTYDEHIMNIRYTLNIHTYIGGHMTLVGTYAHCYITQLSDLIHWISVMVSLQKIHWWAWYMPKRNIWCKVQPSSTQVNCARYIIHVGVIHVGNTCGVPFPQAQTGLLGGGHHHHLGLQMRFTLSPYCDIPLSMKCLLIGHSETCHFSLKSPNFLQILYDLNSMLPVVQPFEML